MYTHTLYNIADPFLSMNAGNFSSTLDADYSILSDPFLLAALDEDDDEIRGPVPLPSSLLKMKQIQLDIRNSQIRPNVSRTLARLQANSKPPNNAFSLFDFNPITEHKPTSHKWSKLTALPHIEVRSYHQNQPVDGHVQEMDMHGNICDPLDRENETAEEYLPQENSFPSEPLHTSQRKEHPRQKPMNIGNVIIEFNMFPENAAPQSNFSGKHIPSTSEGRIPVNSTGNASTGTTNMSGLGHKMPPVLRSRGYEQFSTINIGDTVLSRYRRDNARDSMRGLEKRMSDLQNAVLVNNWIKILESTKSGDEKGGFSFDGRAPGVYAPEHAHSNVTATNKPKTSSTGHPKFAPATNFGQRQATMASVNLAKFFNVPSSVLRDFDRLKQLNTSNFSEVPPRVHHVDEGLIHSSGVHLRPEGKPHMAGAAIPSISDPREQHHGPISYRRWLPRMNAVDEGLTDLLAVQRLQTGVQMDGHDVSHNNKSHDAQSGGAAQDNHPMVRLHNLDQEGMEPQKQEFHSKLKIRVNIPRNISDSVSIKSLPKLSPRAQNTLPSGFPKMGSIPYDVSADQHVDNLLLNLPNPERKYRDNQCVIKRDKARRIRQNPFLTYSNRREMPVNAYPELSIVGSCMLDTSVAAWREEAKALIIQMLESKGN